MPNTKEHQKQKVKCYCGMIIGKYKVKDHLSRWTHHYYAGELKEFYYFEALKRQQKNLE